MKQPHLEMHRDGIKFTTAVLVAAGAMFELFTRQSNGFTSHDQKPRSMSDDFASEKLKNNELYEMLGLGCELRPDDATIADEENFLDHYMISKRFELGIQYDGEERVYWLGLVDQIADVGGIMQGGQALGGMYVGNGDVNVGVLGRDGTVSPRMLPAPHRIANGDAFVVKARCVEAFTPSRTQYLVTHLYGRTAYVK